MVIIFFFFIFVKLINISFSLIPIWNLKESSIDLLPERKEQEYSFITLYDEDKNKVHINLTKIISKDSQNINTKNIIKINTEYSRDIQWELVEGYFFDNVGHFICPKSKGTNYLNQYNNNNYNEIQPEGYNFGTDNEWELNCFPTVQVDAEEWIILGFLNMKTDVGFNFLGKKITELNIIKNIQKKNWRGLQIDKKIFDFLWPNKMFDSQKFNIFALTLKNNGIYLCNIIIQIGGADISGYPGKYLFLGYKSEYSFAYFNHSSNTFYWALSNSTDEFESGYSTESLDLNSTNVNVHIINNKNSPFRIFDKKASINKLQMIRNTRFVYYEIYYDNDQSIIYRGIIDIKLNSIIFHTNETIKELTPLNFSLIAITDETAYQICAIKYREKCVEACPNNQKIYLDTIKGNHCGGSNSCSEYGYLLLPNEICIKECRNDIYYINEEKKECELCMDIDEKKKYKIISENECLETRPHNTYFIYENYNILDYCSYGCRECRSKDYCYECEQGFNLINNSICQPKNCYKTCEVCTSNSKNENDQMCTKCKEGFYLDGNNCLSNCKDGYYKDYMNRICSSCHENCKKCSNGPIDSNENCDSCKSDLYLINVENYDRNCTATCPNETFINTKKKQCLGENTEEEEEEDNNLLLWIYIIIIGFCLLIIIICIFKKIYCPNKTDNNLISDISTELQSNNKIMEEE